MVSLQEFLNNTTWNPILDEHEEPTMNVLHLRIRVKTDSTVDNLKVTLCGHDLRVDFENKNEPEHEQVTLWPTAELDKIQSELRSDGFLHITVPIKI